MSELLILLQNLMCYFDRIKGTDACFTDFKRIPYSYVNVILKPYPKKQQRLKHEWDEKLIFS